MNPTYLCPSNFCSIWSFALLSLNHNIDPTQLESHLWTILSMLWLGFGWDCIKYAPNNIYWNFLFLYLDEIALNMPPTIFIETFYVYKNLPKIFVNCHKIPLLKIQYIYSNYLNCHSTYYLPDLFYLFFDFIIKIEMKSGILNLYSIF